MVFHLSNRDFAFYTKLRCTMLRWCTVTLIKTRRFHCKAEDNPACIFPSYHVVFLLDLIIWTSFIALKAKRVFCNMHNVLTPLLSFFLNHWETNKQFLEDQKCKKWSNFVQRHCRFIFLLFLYLHQSIVSMNVCRVNKFIEIKR